MFGTEDCTCCICEDNRRLAAKPRVITMNCEMPTFGEPELPKYERPEGLYRPDPLVPNIPPSRPTDAIDEGHGPLVQVLMKQVRDLELQNSALQQSNNQLLERARRAEALNRDYRARIPVDL